MMCYYFQVKINNAVLSFKGLDKVKIKKFCKKITIWLIYIGWKCEIEVLRYSYKL